MKIALISDIHGNFKALEAVFDDIAKEEVERVICLGDIATLGPQPRQVIKKLKVLGIECIMGNHDEALGDLENIEKYRIPDIIKSTLQWCRDQLNEEEMTFLSSFKKNIEIPLGNHDSLVVYHGSFNTNTLGVLPDSSKEDAKELMANKGSILAGGHTHLQMDRIIDGTRVISAGSVGCPFVSTPVFGEEPELLLEAQYAIVSYEDGKIDVNMRSIPYDLDSYKRVLEESDLPAKEWWLRHFS